MNITIAAVGRLKNGPERALMERYIDRAQSAGRRQGLSLSLREYAEGPAATAGQRRDREAAAILNGTPRGARLLALDETGRNLTSREFAEILRGWRDGGTADLVVAIGGPDGHGKAVLDRAADRVAFGAMTWPHQLVRPMLAEQLYRAVTILAGHPYHRS